MDSIPSRNKRLESAISILLLTLLFLIALGVFLKQMPKQTKDLSFLLPYGFKVLSEIEIYNSENLYEKINGKAPLYIDSGFKELSYQRFVSQADENLVMELYIFDMAAARNAFSVYSVQKRPGVETLPDMRFAYKTTNALYLVHGHYYIEVVGFSESARLVAAMPEVARKIRMNMALEDDTGIPEIELLPQDNLVPGSIKLYLANAFGFDGFTDIFTCRYKLGDESITAFISKRPDPEDARTTAESYYNFLIENDAADKPTANKTLKDIGAKVLDFYDTTEIIFATGPFVGGIHEAENQKAAEELAVMLIDELAKAAGND